MCRACRGKVKSYGKGVLSKPCHSALQTFADKRAICCDDVYFGRTFANALHALHTIHDSGSASQNDRNICISKAFADHLHTLHTLHSSINNNLAGLLQMPYIPYTPYISECIAQCIAIEVLPLYA